MPDTTLEDNGCSAFGDCMFSDFLRVSVPCGPALTAAGSPVPLSAMSYVQVSYHSLLEGRIRFGYSVANISRPASYFEKFGIQFEVENPSCGNLIAAVRFLDGTHGLLGTTTTNKDRGVELFSVDQGSSLVLLRTFRNEFSDIKDEDVQHLGKVL